MSKYLVDTQSGPVMVDLPLPRAVAFDQIGITISPGGKAAVIVGGFPRFFKLEAGENATATKRWWLRGGWHVQRKRAGTK